MQTNGRFVQRSAFSLAFCSFPIFDFYVTRLCDHAYMWEEAGKHWLRCQDTLFQFRRRLHMFGRGLLRNAQFHHLDPISCAFTNSASIEKKAVKMLVVRLFAEKKSYIILLDKIHFLFSLSLSLPFSLGKTCSLLSLPRYSSPDFLLSSFPLSFALCSSDCH